MRSSNLKPRGVSNSTILITSTLLLALLPIGKAVGETVVLTPTKDNTLYDPGPDISNGSGVYMFSGNTDGQGLRRALLAFDIAGNVPAGSTITSASLTLHLSMSNTGTQIHTLHRVSQDWGEGASNAGSPGGAGTSAANNDATWAYRFYNTANPASSPAWTSQGGDYSGTVSASQSIGGNGSYTWSSAQMTADVQAWLDNPATNFGWILRGNEGQLKTAKRFDTREISNANNRPRLTIVYGQVQTPPDVTLIAPNGGENLTANAPTTVNWTASDESGISGIDLYVSDDNGVNWIPIALGITNTPPYTWFPANRPTTQALFRVVATDTTFDTAQDESDAVFTISSPAGGLVPTTLRDFDLPGSQPLEAGILNPPEACAVCHGDYDQAVEPYFNWQGSMMAHASKDLLFEACLAIANQDAPDSGDLCLRCHLSRGWLQGRSVPTTGSQMLPSDGIGVSCDYCHRLVDPIAAPENPAEDDAILAALRFPGTEFGTGMAVVDPTGARRGPFADADSGHPILVSPFHREAALCGTCHDVSNPAFEKDVNGNYVPNAFNTTATDFSPHVLAPVERTYSEWFYSDYNTPAGVYAPQFGGNKDYVATCQDCHLRDVTGQGCNQAPPIRNDLPLHDMTGGSTWLPSLLPTMFPGEVNATAIQAGIARARYMLQNAASLAATQEGEQLKVTVTNETGHKLPTGYPEGRRMWLNVKFYDLNLTLISESAAYNPATGVLAHDAEAKIYEIEPATLGIPGLPDGSLFHFVLNNDVLKDNRIPPRGFVNTTYDSFGGAPVAYSYVDGQYWDDTFYAIPPGAVSAEVTLYYQSTSKEFVEFLRDTNATNTKGQELYDLWANNGKCPPETMATATVGLACPPIPGDFDEDCDVDGDDYVLFEQCASGPDIPHVSGCGTRDLDNDNDADHDDFGIFQRNYTGSYECFSHADCDDTVSCTVDACNPTTHTCEHTPDDAVCDDNLYCNGTETCDPALDCQAGADPCPGQLCDEILDACVECLGDPDCDDGLYCNGAETCSAGVCQPGTPPDCSGLADQCNEGICDEATDSCVASPLPDETPCDNGDACLGDTCQAGVCVPVSCGEPFTVLANGVFDNKNGKDYYAGGPDGSAPMDDLRTTAEENQVEIVTDSAANWWEARYEDLAAGTVSGVEVLVQVRREAGGTGTLVIEVYSGGGLEASDSVSVSTIVDDSNMGAPPTQLVVAVPSADNQNVSVVNDMTVRVYVQSGDGKKVWWSYTELTGLNE